MFQEAVGGKRGRTSNAILPKARIVELGIGINKKLYNPPPPQKRTLQLRYRLGEGKNKQYFTFRFLQLVGAFNGD